MPQKPQKVINPTKVFKWRFCQAAELIMTSRAGVSRRNPSVWDFLLPFLSFQLILLIWISLSQHLHSQKMKFMEMFLMLKIWKLNIQAEIVSCKRSFAAARKVALFPTSWIHVFVLLKDFLSQDTQFIYIGPDTEAQPFCRRNYLVCFSWQTPPGAPSRGKMRTSYTQSKITTFRILLSPSIIF